MKFSSYVVLFVLSLCLTLFSCTKPETFDLAAVRKALEEGDAKWAEAFNRSNAAGVAALYTEDATLLPPNSEIIQGRQGIQNFWNGAIQMGLKDISFTVVNIGGSGDTAYDIGKYSVKIQPGDQESMTDSGKYLAVWKKQADGTWKLHADTWNSSMPIPGQQ